MDTRFADLFVGSEHAHGVQAHKEGQDKPVHYTTEGPASPDDYEAHLNGTRGLGLVPVRQDGTCRFAAIDIDVDTINHAQLYQTVTALKLPLTVCRSKSGGAHLYLFMEEPGFKAAWIITILKRWAGILNYPNAEIFPKQLAINKKNRGNWINLPYFGGDSTTRYAVGPEGARTLDEFFAAITYWDGKDHVGEATPVLPILGQNSLMPPCLNYLAENGMPDGTRNEGLFNFGVYLRKAFPNNWEEQFLAANIKYCKPPLPKQEVVRIMKSVGTTRYQYRCEQEPIRSHCDRTVCLTLPHGVGCMPWSEKSALGEFIISHLRKVETDPPQYIVEINGHDVTVSNEEFYNFERLAMRVEDILDICVPPINKDAWRAKRHELHAAQEIIEAPDDASERGSLLNDVMDFLASFRNSRDIQDLMRGTPVDNGEFICFKAVDLQRFLKLHRRQFIDSNELYTILYEEGARFKAIKILGKAIKVWMFPKAKLNYQTEDYSPMKFDKVGEEL